MIAGAFIAKKSMRRFRIKLELEVDLLRGQLGIDLINVVLGDKRVLAAEKEIDRALNLPGTRQGTRIAHWNTTAIKSHGGLNVLIVMRGRKIGEPAAHTKACDPKSPRFNVAL